MSRVRPFESPIARQQVVCCESTFRARIRAAEGRGQPSAIRCSGGDGLTTITQLESGMRQLRVRSGGHRDWVFWYSCCAISTALVWSRNRGIGQQAALTGCAVCIGLFARLSRSNGGRSIVIKRSRGRSIGAATGRGLMTSNGKSRAVLAWYCSCVGAGYTGRGRRCR